MGPINAKGESFLADLGRLQISGDPSIEEPAACPSVCLSVLIRRFDGSMQLDSPALLLFQISTMMVTPELTLLTPEVLG